MKRVLVVGARPGSLGEAVVDQAARSGYEAYAAGIAGEAVQMDVVRDGPQGLADKLKGLQPHHIVCTVGINMPEDTNDPEVFDWYRRHFETNVIGPMRLLTAWTQAMADTAYLPTVSAREMLHYVAISSNSARIPRSTSGAYCASKAALSMALRVAARDGKGGNGGYIVYGYEPGLLAGTPMTMRTEEAFPNMPLHRMRGEALADGIPPEQLAALIVGNLGVPGASLNGSLIDVSGGEV